jgi:hypothetical protein
LRTEGKIHTYTANEAERATDKERESTREQKFICCCSLGNSPATATHDSTESIRASTPHIRLSHARLDKVCVLGNIASRIFPPLRLQKASYHSIHASAKDDGDDDAHRPTATTTKNAMRTDE